MKKKNNSLAIILVGVIIFIAFCILFTTNYILKNNNKNNEKIDETNNNEEVNNNINKEKNVLYLYTSGDNNATKNDPETLSIYSIDDLEIDFKYHAPWNEKDVTGIAKKIDINKYIYEKKDYKMELNIDNLKDDTIEVKEYINGQLNSTIKLFK